MPSYIAEEQRGTEARMLNVLLPTILQNLQLTYPAANQFGAPPIATPPMPAWPVAEQRNLTQQSPFFPMPSQLATDRSFMDLISVAVPTVQALMPPLVEQLLSFGPPKPDIDQNEEDRFLQFAPQLVGTLAPIVVQLLPGLLQNMAGHRGEQPVRVTDRELNQRFFGPITQAVLPAIVSALPELLAIVHGDQRSPVRYERMPGRGLFQLIRISRNDLLNGHRMHDGDVIYLTETPAPPGTTEVRVSTAPHGLWWKGVQVTDDTDRQICFVETGGADQAGFDSRSVQTGGSIVLWKAKMFGVHTPMYVIPTGDLSPDAKCFTFHWAAG
ncbi:hypothetical protein [Nonomuraea guangzhouensis]|uniref:Uncharacterized protein n=1 Tax=Nonomuraea guangzhouensis TaxID=1291555 RepID=A0ABW4G187_9ACTN|nr:hypothetical protein [Nonomuraea guangzhouensis]